VKGILAFSLVLDLMAPVLAALVVLRLKKSGWPLWCAYGVASLGYLAWVYASVTVVGYTPSPTSFPLSAV
jgi:hypothetical protein